MRVKAMVLANSVPADVAIEAYEEAQMMPCEKVAHADLKARTRTKRFVPLIVGLIALSLAGYLAIWVGGLLAIVGAALLGAFAAASIKTALFATERAIDELTNPDLRQKPAEDTVKGFIDRI
jgi:hypothetical protein